MVTQLRFEWQKSTINGVEGKKLLPLFIIHARSDLIPELLKINTLCYSKVTMEKYKNPSGPVQCYRCQRFGHTSRYCTVNPRCLKCGLNHATAVCTKLRATEPKCPNCSQAHTANYRGCSYYKAARDRLRFPTRQSPQAQTRAKIPPHAFVSSAPPAVNPWHRRKTL